MRVATLQDLSHPEIMRMIKDNYYSDATTLVLRSQEDSNQANLPLIRRIVEEAGKKVGTVKFPIMVSGFDVAPWAEDKTGYGINLVPRDDFAVVQDDRLD